MWERVREVPERVPERAQLLLEVGTEHAGLYAGQARLAVHLEHPVQAFQVDRDHRARLAVRSLERPGDRGPAAKRDEHRVGSQRRLHRGGHLLLAARTHDDVRQAGQVAATLPDQVAQRFPAAVHDAIERLGRDESMTDGLLEVSA